MRQFRVLPLILALALTLSACVGQDATNGPSLPAPTAPAATALSAVATDTATELVGQPTVIGFGAPERKRAAYQSLIEQFNNDNPDLHVQFVPLETPAGGSGAKMFDTEQIVRAADVAETFNLAESDIDRGLVLDLQPLLDADPAFDRTDFFPAALRETNGGIYSIPSTLQLPLLRYNRELWDAASLPPPQPDWSWVDFRNALDRVAKKRGDVVETYGFAGLDSAMTMLLGDSAANGLDIIKQGASAKLDDPTIIQALKHVEEWDKQGIFFAPAQAIKASDVDAMSKLIAEGRAGMWDAQFGVETSGQQLPYAIGTAVLPKGSFVQRTSGERFVISAGTQSPQAAWRWLSFVSRQAIKEPYASGDIAAIPARRSVAESSGYWEQLDQEATVVVRALVDMQELPGWFAFSNQLYAPLQAAIEAVRSGADPTTAGRAAQAQREQLAQSAAAPLPTHVPFVVEPPQSAGTAQEAATIRFATPFEAGRLEQLAKQFNQQNPGIAVELRAVPQTAETPQLNDIATTSDCFLWWSPPAQDQQALLLDLQPLIDADASFPRDDYPAATFAPYRNGSALYGLPQELSFPVLGYNSVQFEQAGIEPPTADWTLDDFIETAARLSKGEGANQYYGFASYGSFELLTFLEQSGAAPTTGSGEDAKPRFTDPNVRQAVNAYLGLLKNSSPNKHLEGYRRDAIMADTFDLRQQGRVGMWYQFGLELGSFGLDEDKTKYSPQVAPLPANASLQSSYLGGNSLHISATTEHQQACWQWMSYLSGEASAVQYGIPARLSVAESAAFLDTAPKGADEVVASYRAQAKAVAGNAQPKSEADIDFYWLYQAVDRALGGEDLDRELDQAQLLTTDFLTCVRTKRDGPACAKQIDPQYNGWQNSDQR